MYKTFANAVLIVLMYAISAGETVRTAEGSVRNGTPLDVGNQSRYRIVTVPSPNKKRIDAMCFKYLSLIPKAKLIPKTSETTVYRLVANTYDTLEQARRRKSEIKIGETPFVMTSEHGFSVIVGSQLTVELAQAEQKRLAVKNISTTILEMRVPLKQWYMKSDEAFDLRHAVVVASKLAAAGVVTILEPAASD